VIAMTMNERLPASPTAAISAETADPEQIDQDVESLEDHAHQHEARRLEEMSR
jgi:hypothetical protein